MLCQSVPHLAFAGPRGSSPCLCYPMLVAASQCLASPLLCFAVPCLCIAKRCQTSPRLAPPLHIMAVQFIASASPSGESAGSGITPLTESAHSAVFEPLSDGLLVLVYIADDRKLIGICLGVTKIRPSISFLKALIFSDSDPLTFRSIPQASLKNPLI